MPQTELKHASHANIINRENRTCQNKLLPANVQMYVGRPKLQGNGSVIARTAISSSTEGPWHVAKDTILSLF